MSFQVGEEKKSYLCIKWRVLISIILFTTIRVPGEEIESLRLDCEYYLAPSLVPGAGRGIIAGYQFRIWPNYFFSIRKDQKYSTA